LGSYGLTRALRIALPAVQTLCANRNRRRGNSGLLTWLIGVPIVAACFWGTYRFLFGIAFAIADAAERPHGVRAILTDISDAVVVVLGFPLMSVPDTPRGLELSRRVFGDDTTALYGLSALNALL
jgi:hypothetical protein